MSSFLSLGVGGLAALVLLGTFPAAAQDPALSAGSAAGGYGPSSSAVLRPVLPGNAGRGAPRWFNLLGRTLR